MGERNLTYADRQRLYDALSGVRALRGHDARALLASGLEALLGRPLDAERRADVTSLVTAYLAHPGGLSALTAVLDELRETGPAAHALRLVLADLAAKDVRDGRSIIRSGPDEVSNMLQKDKPATPSGAATMPQRVAPRPPSAPATGAVEPDRIWGGGIPLRNPDFTGREPLLRQLHEALDAKAMATVLPQALHGEGGVGKTQLAVEYAYRYADRYDVVWWIPAEQQSLVLQSLSELGDKLGVPRTDDLTQAAAMVTDALGRTDRRWLLVYDNADEPEDIIRLIPSAGGHVILTSRNRAWTHVWDAVQVDVFDRAESVELILKRARDVPAGEAHRLADRLGDLPLALDQAASWQAETGMPVDEYLALIEAHLVRFGADGAGRNRARIAAIVKVAVDRLRDREPAVAQLLELFAYLGAEPVSTGLLRRGRHADISEPLRRHLRDPTVLNRTVRQLRRYGLAKVNADQRIQVHRLIQLVMREELVPDRARQSRANVHNLLASANPGEPDKPETWPAHAEIVPHVTPAGLIAADTVEARWVVLDQIRYLQQKGDLNGARRLGERAVEAWRSAADEPTLGPDGELTLLATRHLATALRRLGANERARRLDEDTLDRFRRRFGALHEHTLFAAGNVGAALRVAGDFQAARALDEENLAAHQRVFGDEDPLTLRARNNVAVNLRMLSDFEGAHRIDGELVDAWTDTVGPNDPRALLVQSNLARDLYGLGRYAEALELQRRTLPAFRGQLNPLHPNVLLAGRTLGIALRKTGAYADAVAQSRQNYRDCVAFFGPDHEHALAATMTYANALRVAGQLGEARGLAEDAVVRYRQNFGVTHPLTLAAEVNLGVILRTVGDLGEARALDEGTHGRMRDVLGEEHGYTLCAASGLAIDLALAGDAERARAQSERALAASRRRRGDLHPYTLACAVNAALDRRDVGDAAAGAALDEAVAGLGEVLGPDHPETEAAARGERAECDIEPPPT